MPCAAVAKMIPSIKKRVANTMPVRLPMRSMRKPKKSWPKISPIRYEFDKRVAISSVKPFL